MESSNIIDKQKSIPLYFEFGANVPFAYANYEDCRRYDIEPIPWLWGEYWVRERINHSAEIIGVIVNKLDGTFVNIYKKIHQPHFFYNIINQPEPLPWHIICESIPINQIKNSHFHFDQILSWDASIIYLKEEERKNLIKNLSKALRKKGSIVLAFTHLLNLDKKSLNFINGDFFKNKNHQHRSNVKIKSFILNTENIVLNKTLSKNIDFFFGGRFYNESQIISAEEIITMKYCDIIDFSPWNIDNDASFFLKNVYITYIGLELLYNGCSEK